MPAPKPDFQSAIAMCSPIRFFPGEHGKPDWPEPVSIQWHRAMSALLMPVGFNVSEIRVDGMEVGEARNAAVETARARKLKYLLFIDSDTCLPPHGFQQLVWDLENYPEVDIVSGLYVAKSQPTSPLIWKEWGKGVYWDFTLGDVIHDVVGCPMGATLLRMSLFDRLPGGEADPWFKTVRAVAENVQDNPLQYYQTEDLYFCGRAIEEANAKIIVDTRVYCEHVDWRTGLSYHLDSDSLPLRRMREKLGEKAA